MLDLLRKWWNLSRAPGNPGPLPRDRWLVAAALVAVVLETILRPDAQWRFVGLAVGIVFAVALVWRRTHPLATAAVVFGTTTVFNILTLINPDWAWELYSAVFVLLFPYSLMRWGSGREQMAGLGMVWLTYLLVIPTSATLDEIIGGAVVLALPLIIGAEVRAWTARRSGQIEQVRLRERGELARELHDTVAHHVSAIAIQAQAGKELAKTDPSAAIEALTTIETEASRTLKEMRTMVGALRQSSEPELNPGRGVSDVVELASSRNDQPHVSVEIDGDLGDLEPAVDSALYRLAQESITNAVRHARAVTRIDVRIARAGSSVRLTVADDGEHSGPPAEVGYGLIGMEERAKLLGGSFSAGPRDDRGWQVTAVLPKNVDDR